MNSAELPSKTTKRGKKGKPKSKSTNSTTQSPSHKQKEITEFCSPHRKSKLIVEEVSPKEQALRKDDCRTEKVLSAAKMVPSPTDIGFLKMSPFVDRTQVKSEQSDDGSLVNNETNGPFPTTPKTKGKRNATRGKTSKYIKQVKPSVAQSHRLTDFYPVRRSSRKTNSLIKKEQEDEIVKAVISKCEDGMNVVEFPEKGRGVVSTRPFVKGEFVVEYAGDLISWPKAREREQAYTQDPTIGCYMYYFNAKGQNFCIDATAESGRLGRLLNHSRRNPNCLTRLIWVQGDDCKKIIPRLVIVAKRDIETGEELTYDYGDRNKSALEVHPWLKT